MTTKDIFILLKDMIFDIIKTNNLIVSQDFITAIEKFEESLDEGYSL